MQTVHAVYRNGVFLPTEDVELPEHSKVEFEPRIIESNVDPMAGIYAVLAESYSTGRTDIAERHNEHQP